MNLLADKSIDPGATVVSPEVEQPIEASGPVAAESKSEKIQTSSVRVEGLPGDLRHLLEKTGWEFVGAILETAAAAIGRSAFLKCDLWPRPVHAAFAWAMCYEREAHSEGVLDQIVQPLRDEADRKLQHLERTKAAIEDQLERVLEEKAHNSDGYLLPNPGKEARLAAEEARLKALGHTTLIADNPKRGDLDLMVHKNGGAGLLVCYTAEGFAREWASLKRSPRNFEIISCGLQGKTPPQSSKSSRYAIPVRPVIGFNALIFAEDISALLGSADPLAIDFRENLTLARSELRESHFFGRLPSFWQKRLEGFCRLREAADPRKLRLSRHAEQALKNYSAEVHNQEANHQTGLAKGPRLAAQLAIILHLWKASQSEEVSHQTMQAAIALARLLMDDTAAVAEYVRLGREERALRGRAAVMLKKIEKLTNRSEGAPTRRELYRSYDDARRELHDPVLDYLLSSKAVVWGKDNRILKNQ